MPGINVGKIERIIAGFEFEEGSDLLKRSARMHAEAVRIIIRSSLRFVSGWKKRMEGMESGRINIKLLRSAISVIGRHRGCYGEIMDKGTLGGVDDRRH